MTRLYIVVPCYNEAEVLPETTKRLREKMNALLHAGRIDEKSRVLLVNDGSNDKTWEMIRAYHAEDRLFSGLSLSRNRGHQFALLAGLEEAAKHCDCAISMDADLQDDIHAIDAMLEKFSRGSDIVYGVRASRAADTPFKRTTAQLFYKFMTAMGAQVVYNHSDYRLMSKRALDALLAYGESNLFLRGIVPQLGFPSEKVEYTRAERFAGESKYPLRKMLALALEGITSFSVKPIRLVLFMGVAVFLISVIMLLWTVAQKIAGVTVSGWSSIMFSVWMLGGLQLLAIGIVGEYVGKAYQETKHRPRYFIEEALTDEPAD